MGTTLRTAFLCFQRTPATYPLPQVCLLDLEYGLPVQVRDAAMGAAAKAEEIPQSEVGIEFQLNEAVQAAANGAGDSSFAKGRPSEMLARLQRSQPYYKVCLWSRARS